MEQQNNKQTETNEGCKISPEEIAILDNFEQELTKQARDLQGSLSDMSAEKLASVFFGRFVYFMTEGRATILSESEERFAIKVWDLLLSRTLKQAEKKIKDESEIIHRSFVRVNELEKTLHPDDVDQIDEQAIINEEADKYYAEKKDNDPEAD